MLGQFVYVRAQSHDLASQTAEDLALHMVLCVTGVSTP